MASENVIVVTAENFEIEVLKSEVPVLVDFWATWCPVCPTVSPTVDWLSDDYTVISVALRSGHDKKVSAYLQSNQLLERGSRTHYSME